MKKIFKAYSKSRQTIKYLSLFLDLMQFVCGVDIGLRKSHVAVLNGRELVCTEELDDFICHGFKCPSVGIDAPLSFPKEGNLRECEKELLKLGIRLFPSGARFFRRVAEKGIEVAEIFRKNSVVFEVYPYATRVMLQLAPEVKKFSKKGREQIVSKLKGYVRNVQESCNHNEIDAILAALTVTLYHEGKARLISGKDGSILIPTKTR
jgi:hypothetical protein